MLKSILHRHLRRRYERKSRWTWRSCFRAGKRNQDRDSLTDALLEVHRCDRREKEPAVRHHSAAEKRPELLSGKRQARAAKTSRHVLHDIPYAIVVQHQTMASVAVGEKIVTRVNLGSTLVRSSCAATEPSAAALALGTLEYELVGERVCGLTIQDQRFIKA